MPSEALFCRLARGVGKGPGRLERGRRTRVELEAEYANYLQSLGAPNRLIRKYAYGNAVLPQMSGLALALGAVVGGALVTEIVFGYPGVGTLILAALQNRDYFLLQGLFLFIIVGILLANFIVDILYVLVDPRTRMGIQGS